MKRVFICSRDQLFKRFNLSEATKVYNLGDSAYKRHWFAYLAMKFIGANFTVYDDHKGVLAEAQKLGFIAHDAIKVNELLAHYLDQGFIEGFEQGIDQTLAEVEQVIQFDYDQDLLYA